jgi:hypothetical protein
MWEPRRLTNLWGSAVCYTDSFTSFIVVNLMHRWEKFQIQERLMRERIFLFTACPRIIVFSRLQEWRVPNNLETLNVRIPHGQEKKKNSQIAVCRFFCYYTISKSRAALMARWSHAVSMETKRICELSDTMLLYMDSCKMLTIYTHDLELQALTALSLIFTLYKSLHAESSQSAMSSLVVAW